MLLLVAGRRSPVLISVQSRPAAHLRIRIRVCSIRSHSDGVAIATMSKARLYDGVRARVWGVRRRCDGQIRWFGGDEGEFVPVQGPRVLREEASTLRLLY